MRATLLILVLGFSFNGFALAVPDRALTPGALCTTDNPDFIEFRYAEHIAYCKRDVSRAEKEQVAHAYGDIPESEWRNYEFDHLIPLSAGGTSGAENIWPQPIAEAHEKDKLEQQLFDELRDGEITQAQAVKMVRDWFDSH